MKPIMLQLGLGHLILALCGGFYLAWWGAVFRPGAVVKRWKGGLLILAALLLGMAAIGILMDGIRSLLPGNTPPVPLDLLVSLGVAAYIVLLFGTLKLFRRQVTTELLLLCVWAMLELAVIDAVYGAGQMSRSVAHTLLAVIGLSSLFNLVSYVLYYRLGERLAFIDGMVPLAVTVVAAVIMAIAVLMP